MKKVGKITRPFRYDLNKIPNNYAVVVTNRFCLRREEKLKAKGEKERYIHLKSEFQKRAKRDKKAFLSDQCKETEETNRFPGGSDGKASAHNVVDPDSIPGSGRSPGEGNGNPLQYPCLENGWRTSMDGGPWWATVHGVAKSWTRLSDFTSLRD